MWQKETQDSAIVRLALLLAIGTMPMAVNLLVPTQILAQSATDAPAFPLPKTLENGTTVRIDGSSGLSAINENLKQSFEKQFSGTKVEVAANGTDAALKAVLDGKVDIAALGRGLTKEEQAQGLEQVRLYREKIAIIVGEENPFKESLTSRQFARIFRGQITDWSQLGGAKGKIRVIDRPTTSDTRNTFRTYPSFKTANFATGATATQVADDNTTEIVKQLGKDGISYALANEVSQLPGVRVLQVDQLSPTEAKYPFSQPLVYVYKKNPSIGTAGFLGFAIAPPGQQAIEAARTTQAAAFAQGELQALATTAATSPTAEATTVAIDANATTAPTDTSANPPANNKNPVSIDTPFLLLLPLLVLGVLGGLSYLWTKRRPSTAEIADKDSESTLPSTAEDAKLPAGAGVAITSDPGLTEDTTNNGEAAWHTEAPAAVVNTSYPHLPEVPKVASDSELPKASVASTADHSEEPIVASNIENWHEEQPQPESNITENLAATGGSGIEESNFYDNTNPTGNSNYSLWDSPDSDLPVIETAATIPDLPDFPEQTTDGGLPVIETAATIPDLPDFPEQTTDGGLPVIETAATIPDLPDFPEQTTDGELPVIETAATIPDLPDFPDLALDAVADEAESTADGTEEEIIEIVSNLPEQTTEAASNLPEDVSVSNLGALAGGAAVAAGAGIGAWAKIYDSNEDSENNNSNDAAIVEDSVNLRSHTPKWAYVSWLISDNQKQAIQDSSSRLALRLFDVTDMDLSYQSPHLVQEYECDTTAHDRFVEIPKSDRNYIAEIGYVTEGDRWVKIAHSAIVRVFSNPFIPGEETADLADNNLEDSIIFTPQTKESATVSWQLADVNKQVLQDTGYSLALRIYDVTSIDLSYQTPQFIEQYEIDPTTENSVVAIPQSDRDYIAEIGYATDSEHWVSIARSEMVRVFSHHGSKDKDDAGLIDTNETNLESSIILTPRTAKWAYVTWYIPEPQEQVLLDSGISQLVIKLFDVTGIDLSYQNPQLVQQYECEVFSRDRFVAIPNSDRDYIVEIGYVTEGDRWESLARSATVRIFSRPYPDFWFVADAEIIVHGATEPDATVNIAGHPIKIKPDGTFHFRVPFSDSFIEYLMTATSAHGKQTKTIHKKFSQETPED
ncbi:hypothetical protein NIES2100_23320 [Calothrix sp. NIES-2100]|uniref:DUF4912 domain-containing protein n=1 Tax=Calothrix sp. NIES-2100 TaxID=1954172 RepID=UPI000B5EBAF9|nr:hypothetical protein NIES2100_23320 [Calothrix sp. NIES-2100]